VRCRDRQVKNSMLRQLKRSIEEQFPLPVRLWRQIRYHPRIAGSPERIFTAFYQENRWGSDESRSGVGSNLDQTVEVRRALPLLVEELGCRSLLDLPCGDFNWMRLVPLDIDYIGGDIVAELIARNQEQYGDSRRQFLRIDLLRDPLPAADLVLCRDCLVHLSNAAVFRALRNIKAAAADYLLTTTFIDRSQNENILTGLWRPINLQLPPFNFPPPLRLINENSPGLDDRDKHLGLWRTEDIPSYD